MAKNVPGATFQVQFPKNFLGEDPQTPQDSSMMYSVTMWCFKCKQNFSTGSCNGPLKHQLLVTFQSMGTSNVYVE